MGWLPCRWEFVGVGPDRSPNTGKEADFFQAGRASEKCETRTKTPMPLTEAKTLILGIVKAWLRSKESDWRGRTPTNAAATVAASSPPLATRMRTARPSPSSEEPSRPPRPTPSAASHRPAPDPR